MAGQLRLPEVMGHSEPAHVGEADAGSPEMEPIPAPDYGESSLISASVHVSSMVKNVSSACGGPSSLVFVPSDKLVG